MRDVANIPEAQQPRRVQGEGAYIGVDERHGGIVSATAAQPGKQRLSGGVDLRLFGSPLCQEAGSRGLALVVFRGVVVAGSVVGAGPGSG